MSSTIDFSNIIFREFLDTQSPEFDIDLTKKNLITDLEKYLDEDFLKDNEFNFYQHESNLKQVSAYTDGNIIILTKIKQINGKKILCMYLETVPPVQANLVTAISSSSLLQLYILRKFELPCITVANNYQLSISFNTTTNFSIVKALNNSPFFVFEALCVSEHRHLLFPESTAEDQDSSFPTAVLKVIINSMFSKFGICNTFEEAVAVVKEKISTLN